jgi:antitoxin component YwqK of YwqJK toxin-antitoxin module
MPNKMPNKIPLEKYFENIKIKTGKTPADFKKLAIASGYFENGKLKESIKAGEVIAWLKKDFDLGHGHSLAIFYSLKDE